MTYDELVTLALALPGAWPDAPWGDGVVAKGRIVLDGTLPDEEVTQLLATSYDLVVASLPRSQRPVS